MISSGNASESEKESTPKKKPTRQVPITAAFLKKKAQEEWYAELICLDGFSFNQAASSELVRSFMQLKGFVPYTSHNSVKSKVFDFYRTAKKEVIETLQAEKQNGERFSLTLDEYTGKNRRFMCVNVHKRGGTRWCLGLIRVWGSQTAHTLKRLIEMRLQDFQIGWDDVIAVTTDGASVMLKLGRLLPCHHNVCLSHTLHLVVTDVFYVPSKKKDKEDSSADGDEQEDLDESLDVDPNHENDDSDDEAESDEEEDSEGIVPKPTTSYTDKDLPALKHHIDPVVKKVRKIVNKFRKSPVKNDALQKAVKTKWNKELTLVRDCKTRWSSMVAMLERYLKLEDVVNSILNDFNLASLKLNRKESDLIKDAVSCLAPFQLATTFLCKQDQDLAAAEKIIRFVEDQLKEIDTKIAKELLQSLQTRYHDRKNGSLVSETKFLQSPEALKETDKTYQLPSRAALIRSLKSTHSRLFNTASTPDNPTPSHDPEVQVVDRDRQIPESEVLFSKFCKYMKNVEVSSEQDTFSKEVQLYISGGERTSTLVNLFNAYSSIPPTSVEAERVFSVTGLFLTELRSKLNPETLDVLVFLKYYLLNKKAA